MPSDTPAPDSLKDLIARLRHEKPGARVLPVDHDGRRYWLKQAIDEGWRKRLSKGDAAAALEREHAMLSNMAARGVDVPEVVDSGPGYLLLADCGPTLDDIVRTPGSGIDAIAIAFEAAGAALAALHARGLAHGRAKIKDLCWDGARIRYIDFEDRPRKTDPAQARLRDLTTFVLHCYFSAIGTGRDLTPALDRFVAAYRAGGGEDTCRAAAAWARSHAWMRPIARPVALLTKERRAPDFKAVSPALDYMLSFDPR